MVVEKPYLILHKKRVAHLEIFNIIDNINARKTALEMTNQQIADASGIPVSTVNRILRKETEDPRMQTVLAIAAAVGYDFNAPSTQSIPENTQDSQYIRHIISMYEAQIADLKRTNNQIRAEKNRRIDLLMLLLGVAVGGWVCIYMLDITNPNAGWFQDQGHINISVLTLAILAVFVVVFSILKKKTQSDGEK